MHQSCAYLHLDVPTILPNPRRSTRLNAPKAEKPVPKQRKKKRTPKVTAAGASRRSGRLRGQDPADLVRQGSVARRQRIYGRNPHSPAENSKVGAWLEGLGLVTAGGLHLGNVDQNPSSVLSPYHRSEDVYNPDLATFYDTVAAHSLGPWSLPMDLESPKPAVSPTRTFSTYIEPPQPPSGRYFGLIPESPEQGTTPTMPQPAHLPQNDDSTLHSNLPENDDRNTTPAGGLGALDLAAGDQHGNMANLEPLELDFNVTFHEDSDQVHSDPPTFRGVIPESLSTAIDIPTADFALIDSNASVEQSGLITPLHMDFNIGKAPSPSFTPDPDSANVPSDFNIKIPESTSLPNPEITPINSPVEKDYAAADSALADHRIEDLFAGFVDFHISVDPHQSAATDSVDVDFNIQEPEATPSNPDHLSIDFNIGSPDVETVMIDFNIMEHETSLEEMPEIDFNIQESTPPNDFRAPSSSHSPGNPLHTEVGPHARLIRLPATLHRIQELQAEYDSVYDRLVEVSALEYLAGQVVNYLDQSI